MKWQTISSSILHNHNLRNLDDCHVHLEYFQVKTAKRCGSTYAVTVTVTVTFTLIPFSVLKNDKSTSGKSTGNLSWVFDAHQPQQQFLEKSQKLQKSQFLLGNLPPPLPLKLINFRKKAISPIFRNLWRNRSFCWAPFYLLRVRYIMPA